MKQYIDPTEDNLHDPIWNAIWLTIKGWDINVPDVYNGYMGANGNHVTAIYQNIVETLHKLDNHGNQN